MSENWPDIAGRIGAGEHVLPVRVYYEDTDFSGVVYHAGYLRFCERGRSDSLRLSGISHANLHAGDKGGESGGESRAFAVTRIEADFLGAARIDDLLEVRTRFTAITAARIMIEQTIERDERPLFRALVTVVLLSASGRPRRIDPEIASRLGPVLNQSAGT